MSIGGTRMSKKKVILTCQELNEYISRVSDDRGFVPVEGLLNELSINGHISEDQQIEAISRIRTALQ